MCVTLIEPPTGIFALNVHCKVQGGRHSYRWVFGVNMFALLKQRSRCFKVHLFHSVVKS